MESRKGQGRKYRAKDKTLAIPKVWRESTSAVEGQGTFFFSSQRLGAVEEDHI